MDVDRNGMVVLTEPECYVRLRGNGIGRVAVTVGALPAIFPVGYAIHEGAVYFRSTPGTKLLAAVDRAVIAFEADHVDPLSHDGWSVVVVGPSAIVDDAVLDSQLRVPHWLASGPEHLVRITPAIVSGRQISHTRRADPPVAVEQPRGEPCTAPSM